MGFILLYLTQNGNKIKAEASLCVCICPDFLKITLQWLICRRALFDWLKVSAYKQKKIFLIQKKLN